MTKKDFEAFAEYLAKDLAAGFDRSKLEYAARMVAWVSKQGNSRFDADKFYRAAGLRE